MLDVYNLPSSNSGDEQIFIGTSNTGTYLDFHTWQKPRGCSMVHLLAVGAGGGGGSGTVVSVWIFSSFLPDTLYIWASQGGKGGQLGGSSGSGGLTGGPTIVATDPKLSGGVVINANRIIYASGGNGGSGGVSNGVGGDGGAAASTPIIGDMPLAGLGFYQFLPGLSGGKGGGSQGGGTWSTTSTTINIDNQGPGLFVTGGIGGVGTDGTGLSIPGQITGNIINSIGVLDFYTLGSNGLNGFNYRGFKNPFLCTSNTGGGGLTANADLLFEAGPGCGGGGGTGAKNDTGNGQNGGAGFVIITAW